MTEILEYIVKNYTWFLGGAILILLAIIGSYADKTNFGQGKNNKLNNKTDDNEDINIEKISRKGISSLLEETIKEDQDEIINNKDDNESIDSYSNKTGKDESTQDKEFSMDEVEIPQSINVEDPKMSEQKVNDNEVLQSDAQREKISEEEFNKFNEEFNSIIPKKEIINEELLSDIDSLSLDKTQKFNFKDLPDLDDVELPKIKSLIDDTDEDIWKN